MNIFDIIAKKRDGETLTSKEMEAIIDGYVQGKVPDYQMSAFLMAVYLRGLSDEETSCLVKVMINSGEVIDLSGIEGIKVDKHSTGGVADTTTLVLAPLVAAAGVPVAKMSGRGLGHTGGTLDKLEAIPGLRVDLTKDNFIRQVNEIKVAIASQTANLVPADKKMYALRDVTATIDSVPLIAASIISKKIASGSDAIVLDVKTGQGAFMKTLEDSRKLARQMVGIGSILGRKTIALITDMNQPLGSMIGNALEVKEAISVLTNQTKGDLLEVALILGSYMLMLGGKAGNLNEGKDILLGLLKKGYGAEKLRELIKAQGGNSEVVDNPELLPESKEKIPVIANEFGYVERINALNIGRAAGFLGAGRQTKDDAIDPAVGIELKKRVGDFTEKGEMIAVIHANDPEKGKKAEELILPAFSFTKDRPQKTPLIYDVIDFIET